MTIEELYELCKPIPEHLKHYNKYTFLAFSNIIEARLLTINDTLNINTPINVFVQKHQKVLIFPNKVNNMITDLTIRPLNGSAILTVNKIKLPYNIGNLSKDFRYGDPLFLVEGIADLGALKLISPTVNAIAIRSNAIPKAQYKVYASITNNIILIPDNDEAGQSQLYNITKKFKELEVGINIIKQFGDFKDSGDMLDLLLHYLSTEDNNTQATLKAITSYYRNHLAIYQR